MKRWWRTAHVTPNPLVRPVDRLESALLVFVVALVLAAIPFACAFGSQTYADRRAAEAATDRRPATAVLLVDAPPEAVTPQGVPLDSRAAVVAAWQLADGSERTGTISADRGTAKGTRVPVWLDATGNPVAPPPQPGDLVVVGVMTALMTWLGFSAVVGGAFLASRALLDRHRRALWDREWAVLHLRRTP
ncbi:MULTISPECIES: Rv1733c family protein [Amycolatopsis]|uniref:Rv1733c family protein n=1 Tax=Amycolatopsis TaxID=1813 RepID=UPI0031F7BB10